MIRADLSILFFKKYKKFPDKRSASFFFTFNPLSVIIKTERSGTVKKFFQFKTVQIILKALLSALILYLCFFAGLFSYIYLSSLQAWRILSYTSMLFLPLLFLGLLWIKRKGLFFKIWLALVLVFGIALGINLGINRYEESITINTTPNINVQEYLPFDPNSKIVQIDGTLKLTEDLPKLDGAAAVFPVYSAFVHAVYPETTALYDGVFEYNNTVGGYKLLGEKQTDLFFGAYPSEEQILSAQMNGTTFTYTPIAKEAFVFFVHRENPINSLTSEQIRGIYAGKITNWKEVGGRDEEIVAFQRNEGSGSQSMLRRFMGDIPLMEAPSEQVDDFMVGIINKVSDYKNKTNSMGFSFRYYVEGIIQNPDIKLIAVDGITPTRENIKNGSYPIIGPLYAVSYEGNDNENVTKLLEWILSKEGQDIIEETGYVGL